MLYFRLAIDSLFSNAKKFIVMLIMVILSIILIVGSAIIYSGLNYTYESCDDILEKGMGGTGIIAIEETENDIQEFWQDLEKQEEIYLVGDMCLYGCEDYRFNLLEIQMLNQDGCFVVQDGYLQVLCMDVRSMMLCEINLSDGIMPKDLKFDECSDKKYINYIYLGSAYKSIPVGTQYEEQYSDVTVKYVVAGVMEEGQKWINPQISVGVGTSQLDYTIDCTYGVFEVSNLQQYTSRFVVASNDGYSIDEALLKAHTVAEQHEVCIYSRTMDELYEHSCEEIITLIRYVEETLILIIPLIIIMLITMQIVMVMLETYTYGIMCSLGLSKREINIIILIKNIVTFFIAAVIALPIVIFICSKWYKDSVIYIINTVIYDSAIQLIMGILLALITITSLTSIIMLKRYTPVMLMGKRN